MEQSIGEKRVRTDFNVATGQNRNDVSTIKNAFADLINQCEAMKDRDPRLAAESMTRIEDAAHWMVKLTTA